MTKQDFAKFVYSNLMHEGMEAILYNDGYACTRQAGSRGNDEKSIVVTVPLGTEYWHDGWYFDELYDYIDGEWTKREIADKQLEKEIIDGIEDDIFGFYSY